MVNEKHKNHPDDGTLAELAKETIKPRAGNNRSQADKSPPRIAVII